MAQTLSCRSEQKAREVRAFGPPAGCKGDTGQRIETKSPSGGSEAMSPALLPRANSVLTWNFPSCTLDSRSFRFPAMVNACCRVCGG